jgi:hypothetical protein
MKREKRKWRAKPAIRVEEEKFFTSWIHAHFNLSRFMKTALHVKGDIVELTVKYYLVAISLSCFRKKGFDHFKSDALAPEPGVCHDVFNVAVWFA